MLDMTFNQISARPQYDAQASQPIKDDPVSSRHVSLLQRGLLVAPGAPYRILAPALTTK